MESSDFPFFCSVDFHVSVPTAPWDEPVFYVQEITGELRAMTSDTEEIEAGTIKLLLVNATQAMNNRIHLADVWAV